MRSLAFLTTTLKLGLSGEHLSNDTKPFLSALCSLLWLKTTWAFSIPHLDKEERETIWPHWLQVFELTGQNGAMVLYSLGTK